MSREPVQVATLAAQDRFKLFFIALIIVGVFLATLRPWMPELGGYMPHLILLKDWSVFGW
jgi:hypothetical protein